MSQRRKKNFPYPLREFVDADYLHKLSEEEKKWYFQFEDEFYNNQHREGEILNKGLDYDKSELDAKNNAARRDMYANNTRVTVRNNDLTSIIYDSYSGHISESLKYKGLEKTVLELIEDVAIDIIELKTKSNLETIKKELSKLCMDVTKALQLEKKYRKNQRRKK